MAVAADAWTRYRIAVLEPLKSYGWTASGWFPGEGPLLDEVGRLDLGPGLSLETDPVQHARMASPPGYRRAPPRHTRLSPLLPPGALLRTRPHVVHANTLRTLPEARVARSFGLPVVIQVHELPPPGVKRTFTIRLAAKAADVLVVVSEAVARVVRAHAGKTPVLVAHNGVPDVCCAATRLHPADGGHDPHRLPNQGNRRLPRGGCGRARALPGASVSSTSARPGWTTM